MDIFSLIKQDMAEALSLTAMVAPAIKNISTLRGAPEQGVSQVLH